MEYYLINCLHFGNTENFVKTDPLYRLNQYIHWSSKEAMSIDE